METTRDLVSCLFIALLTLPGSISAQTEATDSSAVDVRNLLSTPIAMYILIGIAALYFSITLMCLLLVVCTCYTNHKQAARRASNYEYKELKESSPPISPLDTIPEQVTSDVGSQASSSSLFTSDDDAEFSETRTQASRLSTKSAFIAENQTNLQQHSDSKLANYTPKMSPTPHSDVKVPFSKPSHLHSLHIQPSPRHSPLNRIPDLRGQSPRFNRKTHLEQDEIVKPVGRLESQAVTRVKSNRSAACSGRPDSQKVDAQKMSPGMSRIRNDITPPRSPFRNHKGQRKDVVYMNTAGSYSPKRSPPLCSMAAKKPPEPPLAKKKETSKTAHQTNRFTLVKLIFELKPASANWHSIGTQFKISSIVLDTIDTVCDGRNGACLARVCEEWMKDQKTSTWSDVVRVLRSVSEENLANSIHLRYCSGYLSHSDSQGDDEGKTSADKDETNTVSWID